MTKETQPPGIVCFLFEVLGKIFHKKHIIVPELDATFDSAFRDDGWARATRADPFIPIDSFYLGPVFENFRAMKQLRKYAAKVTVPLLVMHSRVDTRTNFTAAKDFYD